MNYSFRRDYRTEEQFAENIKNSTKLEAIDAEQLAEFIRNQGIKVKLIDNGADNSGKLIKNNVKGDADYIFEIENNKKLVEIKTSPSEKFATIKSHCLPKLIKNNIWTLIVYNNKNKNKIFVLLNGEMLNKALERAEFLPNFKPFGGKDAYRFYAKDVISLVLKNKYKLNSENSSDYYLPIGFYEKSI